MHHMITDIGISIFAATALGFLFHILRQPVILGYFVAGALIGPQMGLKLVTEPDSIEIISELGLILLLFIIGLEMNPKKILSSGKPLLAAGIGQFTLGVLIGLGFFVIVGYKLGNGNFDALYLAIFCGLSSTAIVVKLLYDKFELDTLPGRITLGILIFQDIWAILVLAFQPNFADPKLVEVAYALGKGAGLLGLGFLLSRYALKWIFEKISKTPELVVAVSIAWCAFIAGVAEFIGLSMEMGALIAGVSIASFPYAVHVTANVLPLRDFFLTLFFLALGMKIPVPQMEMMMNVLIIVSFVIVSRFITVYPLLALTGAGRRTAFITSLNLSQISEFSLVIATLAVSYNHISGEMLSTVIYAMAFTSVLASYAIKGNHQMYLLWDTLLTKIGFKPAPVDDSEEMTSTHQPVVILGYHRSAAALIAELERTNPHALKDILVIDFNLEVLKELELKGVKGIFGDISNLDTLEHAHISGAEIIISSIPDMLLKGTNNLHIMRTCRAVAPHARLIATADSIRMVDDLHKAGASEVILPYTMIGEKLAGIVTNLLTNHKH